MNTAHPQASNPITPEVKQAIQRSVLCWVATVDAQGQPHVSPKEVFAVVDDRHVVVANIASPTTVRNVQNNAKVCASFLDIWVQKGVKLLGMARYLLHHEAGFADWAKPLQAQVGDRFPIHGVVVIEVQSVEAIWAPSYRLYPQETTEASQREAACQAYGVIWNGGTQVAELDECRVFVRVGSNAEKDGS